MDFREVAVGFLVGLFCWPVGGGIYVTRDSLQPRLASQEASRRLDLSRRPCHRGNAGLLGAATANI